MLQNHSYRAWIALTLLLVCALALAACGSSSSSSSSSTSSGGGTETETSETSGSGGSAAVAEAEAELKKFEQLPTKLEVTEELKEKPKAGEKVYFINCGFPSCEQINDGVDAAAKALGWSTTKLPIDQGNPATINSAYQQAVQSGASIIIGGGNLEETFSQGLAEAKAKGIPVIDTNSNNPIGKGIVAKVASTEVMLPIYGGLLADQIISESGGKANVALLHMPIYDNIIAPGFEELKKQLSSACPETCEVGEITVSFQDFAKQELPNVVVSYLQAHPEVEYLVFGFSTQSEGVVPALTGASLDVKVTGMFAEPPQQEQIAEGSAIPWTSAPLNLEGWQAVDAAARYLQGMDVKANEKLPVWMITKENLKDPSVYANAPENYPELFESLWKVK